MKKIFTILAMCVALAALPLQAQETKAEMKARFEQNVKKADNGDVIIYGFKAPKNVKDTADIGPAFVVCLAYIDPELDFNNLADAINSAVGKKRTRNGGRPIVDIMKGISKYLARKNMNLQQVKLSGSSAQQKLEAGLPIFAYVAVSPFYNTTLKFRAQLRASTEKIDVWTKTLRKLEQRKIMRKSHTFTQCIISGYNKASGEFLLLGVAEKPVWITEKELKLLILDSYIVRF